MKQTMELGLHGKITERSQENDSSSTQIQVSDMTCVSVDISDLSDEYSIIFQNTIHSSTGKMRATRNLA